MEKIIVNSEIEVTLKMIGGKCKPLILYILTIEGDKRFNELMKTITQISQKTLTNQLRELEADHLLNYSPLKWQDSWSILLSEQVYPS